mgnify:CR=1 FL=1
MNREDLLAAWLREEAEPFSGWDFACLARRMVEDDPPWEYLARAAALMQNASAVVDLDTGGGERFLLCDERDDAVRVFGDGTLTLAGKTADVGQSHVEMPIGYSGESITITLDPRFVIDFLKVLDSDKTFTLELKDGESAAVCSTDDGYGYVIMPLARDR